jgi:hypothetical protein
MLELPTDVHDRIKALSAEGDLLAERMQFENAIGRYNEAWELIPDPKNDWAASTWLLAAIGDACFLGGFFTSGREALRYALTCPGGVGNPFLHLRLGQCEFEHGEMEGAAENLCRAYMLEGKQIFDSESPKYFDFLKTKIKPPVSWKW